MASPPEEVVVPWPEGSQFLATHVRSTLLTSSVLSLQQRGHFERYCELLAPEHREAVLETMAPTWLPIEDAMAHYAACEALDLPPTEVLAMGSAVGDRIQGTFLGQLAKTARGLGANPWTALGHFNRLYDRLFQGGGVQIVKVGPKDARGDIRNLSLMRYAYFRGAFVGVIGAAASLFARKSFTREVPGSVTETSASFSHSWV